MKELRNVKLNIRKFPRFPKMRRITVTIQTRIGHNNSHPPNSNLFHHNEPTCVIADIYAECNANNRT